ncbi:MAG: HlyD family efflux transporter periplasmic adaptor subunit [Candidatus Aminicenantes bacterium]|nr:HlyD family efflux transporter periplasmic adaptor subunit [Candidatus Aminicenantes bacterium]
MGMDRQLEKKKWPPRKIATLAAAAVFVLVVVYLLLFQFNQSTLNVDSERITVSTVTRGSFMESIPQQGTVMPIMRYSLETTEGGRVEKRFLEAGAMVKAGDPIVQLVNTNLLLDIMWREADFIQQSNALRQTRLNMEQYRQGLRQSMNQVENELAKQKTLYERNKMLHERKLVSDLDFEVMRLDYEYQVRNRDIVAESQKKELEYREEQLRSLEEQLDRMEANLQASKGKLDDLVIRAPIAGQLTQLDAEIGAFKTPGAPIGQIDVLDAYSVRALIDEFYITRIEPGLNGEFTLAGKTYGLKVRRVFPAVRENRFEVDLDFVGETPPDLRRGQTLHIRLQLGDVAEDTVLLPRGGFWDQTGGNWVYRLDASGKAAFKHPVRLGRYNPDVYEVLEGLEPGDRVITSSYESFGDMDRLVLK